MLWRLCLALSLLCCLSAVVTGSKLRVDRIEPSADGSVYVPKMTIEGHANLGAVDTGKVSIKSPLGITIKQNDFTLDGGHVTLDGFSVVLESEGDVDVLAAQGTYFTGDFVEMTGKDGDLVVDAKTGTGLSEILAGDDFTVEAGEITLSAQRSLELWASTEISFTSSPILAEAGNAVLEGDRQVTIEGSLQASGSSISGEASSINFSHGPSVSVNSDNNDVRLHAYDKMSLEFSAVADFYGRDGVFIRSQTGEIVLIMENTAEVTAKDIEISSHRRTQLSSEGDMTWTVEADGAPEAGTHFASLSGRNGIIIDQVGGAGTATIVSNDEVIVRATDSLVTAQTNLNIETLTSDDSGAISVQATDLISFQGDDEFDATAEDISFQADQDITLGAAATDSSTFTINTNQNGPVTFKTEGDITVDGRTVQFTQAAQQEVVIQADENVFLGTSNAFGALFTAESQNNKLVIDTAGGAVLVRSGGTQSVNAGDTSFTAATTFSITGLSGPGGQQLLFHSDDTVFVGQAATTSLTLQAGEYMNIQAPTVDIDITGSATFTLSDGADLVVRGSPFEVNSDDNGRGATTVATREQLNALASGSLTMSSTTATTLQGTLTSQFVSGGDMSLSANTVADINGLNGNFGTEGNLLIDATGAANVGTAGASSLSFSTKTMAVTSTGGGDISFLASTWVRFESPEDSNIEFSHAATTAAIDINANGGFVMKGSNVMLVQGDGSDFSFIAAGDIGFAATSDDLSISGTTPTFSAADEATVESKTGDISIVGTNAVGDFSLQGKTFAGTVGPAGAALHSTTALTFLAGGNTQITTSKGDARFLSHEDVFTLDVTGSTSLAAEDVRYRANSVSFLAESTSLTSRAEAYLTADDTLKITGNLVTFKAFGDVILSGDSFDGDAQDDVDITAADNYYVKGTNAKFTATNDQLDVDAPTITMVSDIDDGAVEWIADGAALQINAGSSAATEDVAFSASTGLNDPLSIIATSTVQLNSENNLLLFNNDDIVLTGGDLTATGVDSAAVIADGQRADILLSSGGTFSVKAAEEVWIHADDRNDQGSDIFISSVSVTFEQNTRGLGIDIDVDGTTWDEEFGDFVGARFKAHPLSPASVAVLLRSDGDDSTYTAKAGIFFEGGCGGVSEVFAGTNTLTSAAGNFEADAFLTFEFLGTADSSLVSSAGSWSFEAGTTTTLTSSTFLAQVGSGGLELHSYWGNIDITSTGDANPTSWDANQGIRLISGTATNILADDDVALQSTGSQTFRAERSVEVISGDDSQAVQGNGDPPTLLLESSSGTDMRASTDIEVSSSSATTIDSAGITLLADDSFSVSSTASSLLLDATAGSLTQNSAGSIRYRAGGSATWTARDYRFDADDGLELLSLTSALFGSTGSQITFNAGGEELEYGFYIWGDDTIQLDSENTVSWDAEGGIEIHSRDQFTANAEGINISSAGTKDAAEIYVSASSTLNIDAGSAGDTTGGLSATAETVHYRAAGGISISTADQHRLQFQSGLNFGVDVNAVSADSSNMIANIASFLDWDLRGDVLFRTPNGDYVSTASALEIAVNRVVSLQGAATPLSGTLTVSSTAENSNIIVETIDEESDIVLSFATLAQFQSNEGGLSLNANVLLTGLTGGSATFQAAASASLSAQAGPANFIAKTDASALAGSDLEVSASGSFNTLSGAATSITATAGGVTFQGQGSVVFESVPADTGTITVSAGDMEVESKGSISYEALANLDINSADTVVIQTSGRKPGSTSSDPTLDPEFGIRFVSRTGDLTFSSAQELQFQVEGSFYGNSLITQLQATNGNLGITAGTGISFATTEVSSGISFTTTQDFNILADGPVALAATGNEHSTGVMTLRHTGGPILVQTSDPSGQIKGIAQQAGMRFTGATVSFANRWYGETRFETAGADEDGVGIRIEARGGSQGKLVGCGGGTIANLNQGDININSVGNLYFLATDSITLMDESVNGPGAAGTGIFLESKTEFHMFAFGRNVNGNSFEFRTGSSNPIFPESPVAYATGSRVEPFAQQSFDASDILIRSDNSHVNFIMGGGILAESRERMELHSEWDQYWYSNGVISLSGEGRPSDEADAVAQYAPGSTYTSVELVAFNGQDISLDPAKEPTPLNHVRFYADRDQVAQVAGSLYGDLNGGVFLDGTGAMYATDTMDFKFGRGVSVMNLGELEFWAGRDLTFEAFRYINMDATSRFRVVSGNSNSYAAVNQKKHSDLIIRSPNGDVPTISFTASINNGSGRIFLEADVINITPFTRLLIPRFTNTVANPHCPGASNGEFYFDSTNNRVSVCFNNQSFSLTASPSQGT